MNRTTQRSHRDDMGTSSAFGGVTPRRQTLSTLNSNLPDIYRKFFIEDFRDDMPTGDPRSQHTSGERANFEMGQTDGLSKTHWTIEADLTPKPGSGVNSPPAAPRVQRSPEREKEGNMHQPTIHGVTKHKKVVSDLMTQGKKFRETLKYGFPVQARKTMQNSK